MITRRHEIEYEFGNVLGKGTYSEVFAAKRRTLQAAAAVFLEEMVAIKRTKKANLLSLSEREIPQKEIRTMETIGKHPNAVFMYESYEDEHSVFLVLELAHGITLESKLVHFPLGLSTADARHIMHQLLQAVHHLHCRGIVHMDISPKNVLVDDELNCKLIDFGLAFQTSDGYPPQGGVGTRGYMAPEVAAMLQCKVKESADLWSLGILAYEILCGISPQLFFPSGIEFPDEFWRDKDVRALEFIKSLLQRNPQDRPTIKQALEADWFVMYIICLILHSAMHAQRLVVCASVVWR